MSANTKSAQIIPIMMLLAVSATLQFLPFLRGYHLTADDVLFQYYALTSPAGDWFITGWKTAIWKAKLGEFLSIPIMVYGNAGIDYLVVRVINILLFISSIAIFSLWLKRHFTAGFALVFILLIISTIPLRFFHMPPTSYPFFPSIQIIVLVASLLAIKRQGTLKIIAVLGCTLSMLSSEYTLLLGSALILFELLRDMRRVSSLVTDSRVWVLICALAGHLIVRNIVGSGGYTSVSEGLDIQKISRVIYYHTINGTIFGPTSFPINFGSLEAMDYARSAIVSISAGMSAVLMMPYIRAFKAQASLFSIMTLAVLIVFALTVPIALLPKYQAWCTSPGACVYLESRYAGWAVILIISAIAQRLIYKVHGIIPAVLISFFAFVTALQNSATAHEMDRSIEPWHSAKKALCENVGNWESFLQSDVAQSIPFHVTSERSRADYWSAWAGDVECEHTVFSPAIAWPGLIFRARTG